ncbi:UNVERIFIED_CONTAM: hypothetical protein FKN15_076022 [Acipenser sinensis]
MDPSFLSAFTVRQQTPLSDHNQITVFLKRGSQASNTQTQPSKLYNLNQTYRWAPNSTEEYIKAISSTDITNTINTFLNTLYQPNMTGLNLSVNDINQIFEKAAIMANIKKTKKKINRKQKHTQSWFDDECKSIRTNLRII